jgi:hypothetical protein
MEHALPIKHTSGLFYVYVTYGYVILEFFTFYTLYSISNSLLKHLSMYQLSALSFQHLTL